PASPVLAPRPPLATPRPLPTRRSSDLGVPLSVGRRAARGPPPQLHRPGRGGPPPPPVRVQRAVPHGLGCLRPAHRELRHEEPHPDRKSTRLNSSHVSTSYAVFCLKKKK